MTSVPSDRPVSAVWARDDRGHERGARGVRGARAAREFRRQGPEFGQIDRQGRAGSASAIPRLLKPRVVPPTRDNPYSRRLSVPKVPRIEKPLARDDNWRGSHRRLGCDFPPLKRKSPAVAGRAPFVGAVAARSAGPAPHGLQRHTDCSILKWCSNNRPANVLVIKEVNSL
jgi:hypothetical protein